MLYDLVIRGGSAVTPGGTISADVGIVGEKIAAVAPGLAGRQVIDAAGKLVLPGAVDPHVHLQMPAGATRSSDDWTTGTIAAACGGTTTVIDFVEPEPTAAFGGLAFGSLAAALARRRAEADGQAVIDYGLHMTLLPAAGRGLPAPETLAEVAEIAAAGCPTFKLYTTYEGFRLSDEGLLAAFSAIAAAGGMALVHAENDAGIAYLQAALLAAGHTAPRYHAAARPAALEVEAITRCLALAGVAGCPLYVVHVSTAGGAAAVAAARAAGQAAFGETCPQYLLLTDAEYARPGFEAARYVCSPPLRAAGEGQALWQRLAAGDLQTVGTDHCPFFYEGQKDLGRSVFTAIPGGLPGVESRLALLYTYGVGQGRLTVAQWVDACCTAPARIAGLYPAKGALAPGADADVVVFDPEAELTLTHDRLHEQVDYTPYEGMALRGYPIMTLARGCVVAADGRFVGPAGRGRFVPRRGAGGRLDRQQKA